MVMLSKDKLHCPLHSHVTCSAQSDGTRLGPQSMDFR